MRLESMGNLIMIVLITTLAVRCSRDVPDITSTMPDLEVEACIHVAQDRIRMDKNGRYFVVWEMRTILNQAINDADSDVEISKSWGKSQKIYLEKDDKGRPIQLVCYSSLNFNTGKMSGKRTERALNPNKNYYVFEVPSIIEIFAYIIRAVKRAPSHALKALKTSLL